MENPFVSIIIPAYKMEKYLVQCVDSVLAQTLKNIEVIIVDEGDMDECRRIIDEYEFGSKKDDRIKTIHDKSGGYGKSVNKGIDLARGEYIGIVEADDFVDNNMFEELYNIAKSNDADVVKSDFYYYTTKNNTSRKSGKVAKFNTNKIINIASTPSILKIQPSIWSAIYKRSFLNESNLRFLETAGGSYQDTSFAFKVLSSAKKIVLTNKAYLHYRIDNESSSVYSKGKVFAICDEYHELTRFLNEKPEIKALVNSEKLVNQYNAYVWNLSRLDKEVRANFIEKFAFEFREFNSNNELDKKFYKKINKKEVELLLKDENKYRKFINNKLNKKEKKLKRRKNFSIRINSSRIDIVLFGKQILAIEL